MQDRSKLVQQQFQEKLLAMQAKFKQSLPDRLTEIDQKWSQVANADQLSESIATLHRLVHTLTGSAGTFSCVELSAKCRAFEIFLKNLLDRAEPLTDEQLAQAESLLAAVHKTADSPMGNDLLDNTVAPEAEKNYGRKIMIIDDDADLNQLLCSQLSHFGYETLGLLNLEDLEQKIIDFRPNLAIIDVTLPEGSLAGIEFMEQFDFYKHLGVDIPKIFISGRQDIDARIQAVRSGGASYLTKPLNLSVMLEKVREFTIDESHDHHQVMIIDDDHSLVDLMSFVLEQAGLHVQSVTHPKDALEAISRNKPELILMDVHMPWCNGIELSQVIRQQPSLSGIPIIFLSSETDEDLQFKAVLKGGDDFLCKPIDVNRLAVFIKAKAQRARQLSSLMVKDGLTGLYNHTYIKELVSTEWYRVTRQKTVFSTVLMDIDHFKSINDTYGHTIGDQVLRSLSHFLLQRLRKSDKIGRYGGEEFMVMLPDTDIENATALFQSILQDFSLIEHQGSNGERFNVTFSGGVIDSSGQLESAQELIETVDKTLYRAKHAGRNQVLATEF